MGDAADETFESADACAAEVIPMEAGQIRKGGYIVIKNRPCKVVSVSTSKTGKHGHAKCHFVALDIFTGKKMEELQSSSHNCDVPNVTRTEYTLIDVTDEGFVGLMSEDGDTREERREGGAGATTYLDRFLGEDRAARYPGVACGLGG